MGALGFVATPGHLARELDSVHAPRGLLDPACGEGDLLIAAWRAGGREPGLARRLHGLELDPERARRARRRLRDAIGGAAAGAAAARAIRCTDALLDEHAWPAGTAVVANPPWVSLSGRQRGRLAPELAAAYRAAYAGMAGWPSLHGAFLERIARHVAREGTAARVLVPGSTCERYAPLRSALGANPAGRAGVGSRRRGATTPRSSPTSPPPRGYLRRASATSGSTPATPPGSWCAAAPRRRRERSPPTRGTRPAAVSARTARGGPARAGAAAGAPALPRRSARAPPHGPDPDPPDRRSADRGAPHRAPRTSGTRCSPALRRPAWIPRPSSRS